MDLIYGPYRQNQNIFTLLNLLLNLGISIAKVNFPIDKALSKYYYGKISQFYPEMSLRLIDFFWNQKMYFCNIYALIFHFFIIDLWIFVKQFNFLSREGVEVDAKEYLKEKQIINLW